MSSTQKLHVAIVGGGLGGISLAIALKVRNISFTIYEAKGAFTEIGAGINLAPNGLRALREIEPSLGDQIYKLATRNVPPNEDTWMWVRYGAASGEHADGETIMELKAPPTGNLAMHRQELLATLAQRMGLEHARFNKKLRAFQQHSDHVKLEFEDGTEDTASILVGCDGVHSVVRASMFGSDNIVSRPHFNQDGAYRAVIAMENALEVFGDTARQSQVLLGPNGYMIYYPVNGGTAVNVGVWISRQGQTWGRKDWVVPGQKQQFQEDLEKWGPRVHKLLAFFDTDPAFWAAHQHVHQPESFADGRIILIGDGAHAMPPHAGAGASQAVEDAYVLAEVLTMISDGDDSLATVSAALRAAESVRKPRFLKVQDISTRSGPEWYSFHVRQLEGAQLDEWKTFMKERIEWIWNVDMRAEGVKAKQIVADEVQTKD
ncbi:uncharacterized protein N0V89_003487 [Didymosphaeria variabile]|uniref:FAD-binding domain-containing protein n=1 Tax=Didymosphaeria variabile TaxID=1932322 RepID=A0A9W8XPE1_9PLEO|nr:uncharacterized protein N0V89_003487 [Didymosphaeria variabile]KAJ4355471.1 hypothetical protein N0V89_003487 [Didymosphaeria variabile]